MGWKKFFKVAAKVGEGVAVATVPGASVASGIAHAAFDNDKGSKLENLLDVIRVSVDSLELVDSDKIKKPQIYRLGVEHIRDGMSLILQSVKKD